MEKAELLAKTWKQILSLTDQEDDVIALMATISCELFQSIPQYDWVGFYRNVGDSTLKIGPYQGTHGCLVIPFHRGVCGRCARTGQVQIVADVLLDEEHIACSSKTRSEIVVPVYDPKEQLLAVLDVDSDEPDAFDQRDVDFLLQVSALFSRR